MERSADYLGGDDDVRCVKGPIVVERQTRHFVSTKYPNRADDMRVND